MTSLHIINPEANTPIAASDGQNPYFFIIDTSGRSKREIKPVFSEFFKAFEIFLHSGHKIKLESDSSKVDKDSIETKETHTTAQPAAQIRSSDAQEDIAEGPALKKTQPKLTTEGEHDDSGKEAKTPTANIEPTTQTLSANAKLDAATLSDPIKPTAKAVADDDKSTVDVIAKDTQSIANTPTDNIEPEPDTGSGSALPVIVGLGVAAGGTASIYYAVKKKAVKMTMRMRDSIPMLVRSPEAVLNRNINMEIQEVGISQLNEALSALAFELASALDDVSEVIDNTENAANTDDTEVAANTGNGDNVAVTGNTVIGGTPNPPLKPKNKIILSPSAA